MKENEIRLNWQQLTCLTLGQIRHLLDGDSAETHEGFSRLLWFAVAEIAGGETARACSVLARQVEDYKLGVGPAPDWEPFFTSLKRERVLAPITDETPLGVVSELLWQKHTSQGRRPGARTRTRGAAPREFTGGAWAATNG